MRPVCLHMIFSTLHTTLPHNLFKDILVDVLKEFSIGKVLFMLRVMIGMLPLPLMKTEIIIYGLVRKCVKLAPFY